MVPLNFSPEARPPPRSSRTRRADCGIAAMIRFVLFRFVGLINEEEGARHVSEVQPYSRTAVVQDVPEEEDPFSLQLPTPYRSAKQSRLCGLISNCFPSEYFFLDI